MECVPLHLIVSSVGIIMGGSGGFFPPTGVWGQSPQWGFRGQSPLPPIVLIKICTVHNSPQIKEISKKYNFKKIIFWAKPPAPNRSNRGLGGQRPPKNGVKRQLPLIVLK